MRSTSRSTLEDSDPLRLVRWTQPRSDEAALRLAIDERGDRYPLTIDPIAQQAYLKASNTDGGDGFGSSHKTPAGRASLAKHPRFVCHFIPTSSSWWNLVERWFRELTEQAMRRGVFLSGPDLEQAIADYLAA